MQKKTAKYDKIQIS